jgi:hypothetical protein
LTPPPDRPPDAQTPACPCGHDNVPAEAAGQHLLLERAADGDREAFARLYDTQVDGIYRYLLAWTADPAQAAPLTAAVFHGAFSWLTVTHITDAEAGAWLTAMARDAVVQRRGPGATLGTADPVAAVAQLSDPKREVAVLRLLCGHSLDHTAHLSGFTRRAVLELQLSACLSILELTSGAAAPALGKTAAEEFERHLTHGDLEPSGDATAPSSTHPTLAGPLAVARSLRQTAPGYVVAPDPALVEHLRQSLLTGTPPDPPPAPSHPAPGPHPANRAGPGAPLTHPAPGAHPIPGTRPAPGIHPGPGTRPIPGAHAALDAHPGPDTHPAQGRAPRTRARLTLPAEPGAGPRTGRVAGPETWWGRLSTGLAESRLLRRPWLATGVATAGIVAVLTLQAFGDPPPPGACGGRPCPATTTVAAVAAAEAGSLGTPRTTVLQPSTTMSTVATPAPPPSAPRTSAATTPPSSRPATTAGPTTAPPRTTTTTRATTTTAPTTTVATTTTAAPAPT